MEKASPAHERAIVCLTVWLVAFSAYASDPKPAPPGRVDTTVTINSTPAGALVMVCEGQEFREDVASSLGKTPLMRLMPLSESGDFVKILKAGYRPWVGRITSTSGGIEAELTPLSDDEKAKLGWFVSPVYPRLTIVPFRIGIKTVGSTGEALDQSEDAQRFTKRFMAAFEATISRRFGAHSQTAHPDKLTSEGFWKELTAQMQGVRIVDVGFTPTPRQLHFNADETASLAELDSAVLLVSAEAHYLGKGAAFARVAVPLLLTAASAGGAAASGGGFYTVYGPAPTSDVIQIRMYLVHAATRELLWYGEVSLPQYFGREQVTEKAASKAAEQVPAGFVQIP